MCSSYLVDYFSIVQSIVQFKFSIVQFNTRALFQDFRLYKFESDTCSIDPDKIIVTSLHIQESRE